MLLAVLLMEQRFVAIQRMKYRVFFMMEPSHTCSLINALNHTMMTSELRMVYDNGFIISCYKFIIQVLVTMSLPTDCSLCPKVFITKVHCIAMTQQ